ncbi:MAG TPA: hypothetical protein VN808_11605 [Stellaceae bacterium]|nr:hypothetical protein [Stellaceae bacterium]
MSYSSLPGPHRFDVTDETVDAYRAVFDNVQLVIEMALLPFAMVLAIELVALILPGGGIFGRLLAALVSAVGMLIFGTIFVVRWHRFVLLGEAVAGGLVPPGWSTFLVTSLKLMAIIVVGWIILGFVALLPPHILTMPLTAIGGIALTLGSMRVSLIFPAAAIERPIGFVTASNLIAGNFWRLFVCLVMCYLPFVVAGYIVIRIGTIFPALFWIVFQGLQLAVSFVGIAVVAALLSHLYREIAMEAPPAA